MSAHLEVGSMMCWAKAYLTLDDAEVGFDGVLCTIDGADTVSRFSDFVVSDENAEAIGAVPLVPVLFVEGEFNLVAHLAFVSGRADVDVESSQHVLASKQLVNTTSNTLFGHLAATRRELNVEF